MKPKIFIQNVLKFGTLYTGKVEAVYDDGIVSLVWAGNGIKEVETDEIRFANLLESFDTTPSKEKLSYMLGDNNSNVSILCANLI